MPNMASFDPPHGSDKLAKSGPVDKEAIENKISDLEELQNILNDLFSPLPKRSIAAKEAMGMTGEGKIVEDEKKEPVNLLGRGTSAPSHECNLQQCITL